MSSLKKLTPDLGSNWEFPNFRLSMTVMLQSVGAESVNTLPIYPAPPVIRMFFLSKSKKSQYNLCLSFGLT